MKAVTGKSAGKKWAKHCRKCFTQRDGLIAQVSTTAWPVTPGIFQTTEGRIKNSILCFIYFLKPTDFFLSYYLNIKEMLFDNHLSLHGKN